MNIQSYFNKPVSAAPLATFRILFGLLMLLSMLRFWMKGWIETLYINPQFHFSYEGFEWIKPLGVYTYAIFILCGISALLIAIGYQYRIAIILFFLSFTYIELMDKTTYLNHYYFISIIAFIMIFLPANVYASIDAKLNPKISFDRVPRWTILSIQLMLCFVYFYAGLAKLNSDWLLEANPLKIWLPTKNYLPIIGGLMTQEWFHYAMSWMGALYDLSIPFLLFNRKTRGYAFIMVVIFHVFTSILFPIGMFPYIMICATLIFFSASWHQKLLDIIFRFMDYHPRPHHRPFRQSLLKENLIKCILGLFLIFQAILPFRYLANTGELFWTEEGFRFSWRVMLMEKAGYITFQVKDSESGTIAYIEPSDYLTPFQVKQMAFQPDFILKFAHFLANEYKNKGFKNPQVYADSYVALNGRRSQRYINPQIDLVQIQKDQSVLDFLIPFKDEIKGL
ncbi:MAG: HTTM domain-containing protein [Weeksellaceae bacterium]